MPAPTSSLRSSPGTASTTTPSGVVLNTGFWFLGQAFCQTLRRHRRHLAGVRRRFCPTLQASQDVLSCKKCCDNQCFQAPLKSYNVGIAVEGCECCHIPPGISGRYDPSREQHHQHRIERTCHQRNSPSPAILRWYEFPSSSQHSIVLSGSSCSVLLDPSSTSLLLLRNPFGSAPHSCWRRPDGLPSHGWRTCRQHHQAAADPAA